MYKLRKGVTLPKEFKIKVNLDKSKALHNELKKNIPINSDYLLFYKDGAKTYTDDVNVFLNSILIQIHFQDYFYLDFPEKFCIKVTEDNYKELDVWMHRNWNNYVDYHDKWCVEKPNVWTYYFVSKNKEGGGHSTLGNYKNYTLITTDQFRGKFGNLKVHDVEFVNNKPKCIQYSEIVKAMQHEEITELRSDNIELREKAKYYKEKSDRLRKEKFEMSKRFGKIIDSNNNELVEQSDLIENLREIIDNKKDEVTKLKTTIAQYNVTIERVRNVNRTT